MKVEDLQYHIVHDHFKYVDKVYLSNDILKKAQKKALDQEGIIVVYDDNVITLDTTDFIKLKNRFKNDFISYEDFYIAINEARNYFFNLYNKNRQTMEQRQNNTNQNVDTRSLDEIIGEIKNIHKQIDKSLIKYKTHTKKICKQIDDLNKKYPAINNEFEDILDNLSKINKETISKAFKNLPIHTSITC